MKNKSIYIIGAGLTGLCTAYFLKKKGISSIILEKSNRYGGSIQTILKEGFIIEKGPNTGVLGTPEIVYLFDSLGENCKLEKASKTVDKRYVMKKGKWHALPSGLMSAIRTPLFSIYDKFRILGEPFRNKGKNPNENLSELVKRRLGKSFLDYAVDPFILGIYAGDPEYLIPRHALPKLYALEQNYGSFIRGSIKKAKLPKTELEKKADRSIFSVENGLQNLIEALVNEIGKENILLNTKDIKISNSEQSFIIDYTTDYTNKVTAEKVITTCNSRETSNIFEFISNNEQKTLDNLNYAKVVQISLGFNEWKGMPLDGFGGLIPFKEDKPLLGILFLSSFLRNRSPREGALLSIFIGGTRRPELFGLNDKEIINLVSKELPLIMYLPDFTPELVEISRYELAIPQYGLESDERISLINKLENNYNGLIIGGNIKDGIGMADRVKQAYGIAERISNSL